MSGDEQTAIMVQLRAIRDDLDAHRAATARRLDTLDTRMNDAERWRQELPGMLVEMLGGKRNRDGDVINEGVLQPVFQSIIRDEFKIAGKRIRNFMAFLVGIAAGVTLILDSIRGWW